LNLANPLDVIERDSSQVCLLKEQWEADGDERARACHRGSRPDLRETHDHLLKRDDWGRANGDELGDTLVRHRADLERALANRPDLHQKLFG